MHHGIRTGILGGEVILPNGAGYAEASTTFFGRGAPAVVVRPSDVRDVVRAVRHAADEGIALSVRSGGHSMLAHGTNTGGMVLDLRHLASIEIVDAASRRVRVGGGATWGHVAEALSPFGWGLTAGDTAGVGVGGLALGGGMGWLVRQHGLAIDNMISARVVTADGRVLVASAAEHADLFWALRGGGGNFGVVVEFDFIAQPVDQVRFGHILYAPESLTGLIAGWRDHMRSAPEALSSTLSLMPRQAGMPPTAMVEVCFAGNNGDAAAAIEPLAEIATVTTRDIGDRPYAAILENAHHPPGVRVLARNALLKSLDDHALAAVVSTYEQGLAGMLSLRSLGGAFARVPTDSTAFAHRDAEVMVLGFALVGRNATPAEIETAWGPWEHVARLGCGVYVNFQGSATAADLAAAYPPATYARLAEVKRAYDPRNVLLSITTSRREHRRVRRSHESRVRGVGLVNRSGTITA